MDPVSSAIIAALAAGVVGGVSDVGKKVLVEAYDALKVAIQHRLGVDSDVSKAINALEQKPDSNGRKVMLKEEVEASQLGEDDEVLKLADSLLKQVQAQPGGSGFVQQATGNNIAQASHGSTANVNVNRDKD
ncbi:MAG: hypothetical protein OHK0022_10840 [Roseiflexaceae bacterium]